MQSMESQVQSTGRKAELRDKIRALEAERSSLESEINVLKEKVEVKELEAYTVSLENEVGTLRVEKTLLEERASLATPYTAQTAESTATISSLENSPTIEETRTDIDQNEDIVQQISANSDSTEDTSPIVA
jgi:hypothetical protein